MSNGQGKNGTGFEGVSHAPDSVAPTRHSAIDALDPTPPLVRTAAAAMGAPIDVPEFELRKKLGSGGFGEVWLARHRLVGNYRAVKLIPPSHRAELDGLTILLQRIPAHPSLCPILAVGEVGDWLYGVMPLADSAIAGVLDPDRYQPRTLTHYLACSGKLGDIETARIGAEIAEGLMHLHRHGAVHGDVKPANVICIDGGWRLTDYGLLSGLEAPQARGLTRGFAPPEGPGSPKADQHALGVTLYTLKTGRNAEAFGSERNARPHQATSSEARTLDDIIWRAAAADPGPRYASMEELGGELRRISDGTPPGRAPLIHRLQRGAIVVLAALIGYFAVDWVGSGAIAATGVHSAYARWLGGWAPGLPDSALDRIGVIAITDDEELSSLAASARLTDPHESPVALLRQVHGEMAQRLASSGARAVAFDIAFRADTEADRELIDGVQALRNAGIGVVVAQNRWEVDPASKFPVIAGLKGAGASIGAIEFTIDNALGECWPPLATVRQSDFMLSFSFASLLAWQEPTAQYRLGLDQGAMQIEVEYFAGTSVGGPQLVPLRPPSRVQAAHIWTTTDREPDNLLGRVAGDVRPIIKLPSLPEDEAFAGMTISYQQALDSNADQLRRLFADKLVIIGDFRIRSDDWHTVGARRVAGAHLQAAACAALLEKAAPRTLTPLEMQAAALGSSLAGGFVAVMPARRRETIGSDDRREKSTTARRRARGGPLFTLATAGLLAVGLLVLSAVLYSRTGLLIAAPSLILALWLAVGAGLLLRRLPRRDSYLKEILA